MIIYVSVVVLNVAHWISRFRQTGKLQARRLALTPDRRNILVTTNRIKGLKSLLKVATRQEAAAPKVISLEAVDRIQRGATSRRFLLARQDAVKEGAEQVLALLDEVSDPACVSIVHRVGTTFDTLDIVVPNATDFETLLTALEDLVALHHEERQLFSASLQLLHHHWVGMGHEWQAGIRLNDFLQLAEELQVPLKREVLKIMFKEDCALHQRQSETMPFEDVGTILENIKKSTLPRENLPIERMWQELIDNDPVPAVNLNTSRASEAVSDEEDLELNVETEESISAVAFLSFLRQHQKEFRTSLEEATDLVHVLNQQATPGELKEANPSRIAGNDRLIKSRFYAFLTSDANDLLHPVKGKVGNDDMKHPLSHYWINTAHDTFMAPVSNSLHGKSAFRHKHDLTDEQMYGAALLRGVRCLELDVYDGLGGTPVIACKQPIQSSDRVTRVEYVLRIVRHFIEQNPHTFPILLKLENHCSPSVQVRLADLLRRFLGDILVKPSLHGSLDDKITLPTPESCRGKVIIIGKRPKTIGEKRHVRKDDFDAENDSFHAVEKLRDLQHFAEQDEDDDDEKEDLRVIVGFNPQGPIRSTEANVFHRPAEELLAIAEEDAAAAFEEARAAKARLTELEHQAEELEKRASHLTLHSGLTTGELKRKAAKALKRERGELTADDDSDVELVYHEEEKSTKDEGFEAHEVLTTAAEGSRDQYEEAARNAMEAAGREAQCHAILREKEETLRMAKANLEMSMQREKTLSENARRAGVEARAHFEHAESAKERVEKLRQLLSTSKDQSSSAGTVVQTALTEAKISEKRAADAEARASRAAAAAENDKKRADEETRKEESLEHEVNELHEECMKATEQAKSARQRVEKATSMLDRVSEQIKLIETSSQYRKELEEHGRIDGGAVRHGGSFIAKHQAKLDEQVMCRQLIKEATDENAHAEMTRNRFKKEFEDKAYQWRMQADLAAQARKTADRSAHVAEELLEHAEEEREAANLRHIARQRAEATVENKDSYRSSLEAQLAEAERASTEASSQAIASRKRAEHMAREAEKVKDHSRFEKTIEKMEWELRQAQGEYDAARLDRKRKDKIMAEEKSRLDTNAEVIQTAKREVAAESDRIRIENMYQQEAIVAYNQAVDLRKQSDQAEEVSKAATYKAELTRLSAERAKEYKRKMDSMVEIPADLAALTLLHTTKHKGWDKSLSLSNAQVHSFAQNVLLLMLDKNPVEEKINLHAFTKNHLCRIFPSWKAIQSKNFTNYDPVFAWALGCQLVANNFHSCDESLLVGEGRFRQNGSCGYVLKPPYLIDNSSKTEDDQRWNFHILSGHNLPKPIRKAAGASSPMVKISVYSGSAKETRISYRTRPAHRSGLNPVWTGSNKFECNIPTPSISMVCFSVWHVMDDGTENFMAASAMPASCLREGYRSIALFDEHHSRSGAYASACLLIKATKK